MVPLYLLNNRITNKLLKTKKKKNVITNGIKFHLNNFTCTEDITFAITFESSYQS